MEETRQNAENEMISKAEEIARAQAELREQRGEVIR